MKIYTDIQKGKVDFPATLKSILFAACIVSFLLACASTKDQSRARFSTFKWLSGTWERLDVKPGQRAVEIWEEEPSGGLSGMGVTLRGTDTVFIEKLSLVQKDEGMYYVADVAHNPAPVFFKLSLISNQGFTCENPEHDFPKKIVYSRNGDMLTVIISDGEKQGKFAFRKTEEKG